jgi:hypothetical protein
MVDEHQVNSIIATAICDCRKDHPAQRMDPEEAKQMAKCIIEALTDAGLEIMPAGWWSPQRSKIFSGSGAAVSRYHCSTPPRSWCSGRSTVPSGLGCVGGWHRQLIARV